MPIYEFHCTSCNCDFDELMRSADESAAVACPQCSGRRVERKISVFSAHASAAPLRCPMPSEACGGCEQAGGACGLM